MFCSLCLQEIGEEKSVVVDGKTRHESCSKEFEKMIEELEKIYEDTSEKKDI